MSDSDYNDLKRQVDELKQRVARLERNAGEPQQFPLLTPIPIRSRPSLESRLGSQYLNRAGIVALLVAVSYFLHLAFSNNWIGSSLRVVIGLAGGIAVMLLGQLFQRRGYNAFGLSLKALGIGVLYLSIWAAFQLYHLVPIPMAASAMVLITGTTVAMALQQQSEGLAGLAFAGGFATPILLYTGRDLYLELFVYLLLLSSAMLLLVRERPWKNLLLTAFVGSLCVTSGWYWTFFRPDVRVAFSIYCTLMLAIFVTASEYVAARVRDATMTWVVAVCSCLFYLFAVRAALHQDGSMLLMVVGVMFAVLGWRRSPMLRAASFSIGMAYIAVAVPIGVDEHWTTSAIWLALGTALLVVGFVKHLAFVRWDALVLIAVTVCKVFLSDLSRLQQEYRVLAATILGITLLTISFIYQRYRVRQG
jgi:uncharacterized membrane protein